MKKLKKYRKRGGKKADNTDYYRPATSLIITLDVGVKNLLRNIDRKTNMELLFIL